MEEKDPNEYRDERHDSSSANDEHASSPAESGDALPEDQEETTDSGAKAPDASAAPERLTLDVSPVATATQKIRSEVAKLVIGQEDMIELLLAGVLTGGHVLLEGYPGIAKTLTAKMLAKSISAGFSRIQFTPDLMPTDITGTSVFDMKESAFNFRRGPIFSNIILIDEINRAPAKTQAALMEVMEERQVTYDGHTYDMGFPFFVIATQNPIEQEGTYQLPEAQLDRFVFRIRVPYPNLEEESGILRRFRDDFSGKQQENVGPVISVEELKSAQELIEQVYIKDELVQYIAAVVHNTRNNGDLFLGASPRASLAILRTSKAIAAMRGRDFVTPDDIRHVSGPVLNHRVILSHEREMEGTTVEEVIHSILENIEVPR
jgi:MoxR-like ATPase